MNTREFRAFLNLFMCSDPWPLSDTEHQILTEWADHEAESWGYTDWIDAYHELPDGGYKDEV